MTTGCLVRGCGSALPAVDHVCKNCWSGRVELLTAMPELWLRVRAALPPGSRLPGEGGGAHVKPGSRPPLTLCALDALRSTPLALTDWLNICLETPLETAGKRWGYLLAEVVTLLGVVDHRLRGGGQALGYVSSVNYWHRKLALLAGLHVGLTALPGRCFRCDRVSLWRHTGQGRVYCTYPPCGARWDEASFADLVLKAVEGD